MDKTNLTLLNQQEIDTLVKFLAQSKENIDSDVLNQDSIDKLINIITCDDPTSIRLDEMESVHMPMDLLGDLGIRDNEEQICELSYAIDPQTEFVILTATNTVNGKTYTITPASLDRLEMLGSGSSWGYSIPPILFNRIARIFQCKYSRKTYEDICTLYALKNYGSATQGLPSLYYPTTNQLLSCLL